MKSLLIICLLGVFSPLAYVHRASEPATEVAFRTMIYPTANARKLAVVVTKPQGHALTIHLRNAQGELLLGKQIGKPYRTVQTRLDMAHLPGGLYRVIISDDRHTLVRKVRLTTPSPLGERQLVLEP